LESSSFFPFSDTPFFVVPPSWPSPQSWSAPQSASRFARAAEALCDVAGQSFYNTSRFTLRDLKARGSQQQLLADFDARVT
jgi:hypothetical protein